jgi:hypothetical protein
VQRALQQQSRRLSARAVAGMIDTERQQLRTLLQRVRGNLDEAA